MMKFKPKSHNNKMDSEELQQYLQMKRQFNGSFKTKKDYNRQSNKQLAKCY